MLSVFHGVFWVFDVLMWVRSNFTVETSHDKESTLALQSVTCLCGCLWRFLDVQSEAAKLCEEGSIRTGNNESDAACKHYDCWQEWTFYKIICHLLCSSLSFFFELIKVRDCGCWSLAPWCTVTAPRIPGLHAVCYSSNISSLPLPPRQRQCAEISVPLWCYYHSPLFDSSFLIWYLKVYMVGGAT